MVKEDYVLIHPLICLENLDKLIINIGFSHII